MKNVKAVIRIIVLSFYCSSILGQGLSLKSIPEKPKPGERISIKYMPAGTALASAEKVSALIYAYSNDICSTNEIKLKKKANIWYGEFNTPDTCAGVVLRFTDGKNYDDNGGKCFPIPFYDKNGIPVKYASGGLCTVYNIFDVVLGIKAIPKTEEIVQLYRNEFNAHPSSKKQFLLPYFYFYKKIDKEKASADLKQEAENYERTLTQSLEDLTFLSQLYVFQTREDKMKEVNALIMEKYPTSKMAEELSFGEIYGMKDMAKKSELANKFKEQFPNSKYLQYIYDPVEEISSGKYKEAFEIIRNNVKASSNQYNNLAWTMYEKNADLLLAKEVALRGIKLIDAEKKRNIANKPTYYTEDQYKKRMESYGREIIDTYGAILLKLGENEEALKYMTMAHEMFGGIDADVNQRYKQALLANKKGTKSDN